MVKIYSDGADFAEMVKAQEDPRIAGLTCNPSLMRKAGVLDYRAFAEEVLKVVKKPISFEVFADEFDEMERQAFIIAGWGSNCYVKIPVTNTRGESSLKLVARLVRSGVRVNLTAVFTGNQILSAARTLTGTPAVLSIFAGRIADTGINPAHAVRIARSECGANVEILWASTREVYNVIEAANAGADIITLSTELIGKLSLLEKDLAEYSLETVCQFHRDAQAAGYSL